MLNNFRKSDYALNKFSENIVYRFADGIREITPETYLQENPDKKIEDFWTLKLESDRIFLEQDRLICRQDRKTVSLTDLTELHSIALPEEQNTPEEQILEKELLLLARKTLQAVKEGDLLSATQARRFYLYVFQDMTYRQIGKLEGISHQAAAKSIQQAITKLHFFFEEG